MPVGESAKKLENFAKKQFPIGYVRKLFRKNGVRLNGRRSKADETITGGRPHPSFTFPLNRPTPSRRKIIHCPKLAIIL